MSSAPLPRDIQDFQFKLISRFKVFNKREGVYTGPVNALAVTSKHGLIFVASASEIQIFETSLLLENRINKGKGSDVEIFPRRCIPLPSQPSHIGISCDQLHIAVALAPKDFQSCSVALIYHIASFATKDPSPAWELRLSSTPGVTVRELVWNPGLPQLLCICLSNGSLSVYELKGASQTFQIFSLPESTSAISVSWSPKGKQLVIGAINGSLSQYKPDLKQVKTIPAPAAAAEANVAPVSLLWLSSFQFAVVYGNLRDSDNGNSRPGLHIVNAPKGGAVSYLNYDDICYSSGRQRPIQYYLTHQPKWNVLLMSSANSAEVGVLAADGSGSDPLLWEQWTLEDASRAEFPLSLTREEMYAVGMAIDTSPTTPIPWGENQTIPPAPLLVILSHHGVLCAFNILNRRPGAPLDLCSPAELIPGIREMLVSSGPPSDSSAVPTAAPGNLPTFGATSSFPNTTNSSFSFASSSQNPSLFASSPASQTFSSLSTSATAPSLFGAQVQKSESEKSWLSGKETSTFGGFGALGSSVTPPEEDTTTASSTFSFASNSAPTVFSGATMTIGTTLPSQPQAAATFAYGDQLQLQSSSQTPSLTVMPTSIPSQGFPSLVSSSNLIPKTATGDKGKVGIPIGQTAGTTAGKVKFEPTVSHQETGGSDGNIGAIGSGNTQQGGTTSTALPIPKITTSSKPEGQSAISVPSGTTSQLQTVSSGSPVVSDASIFLTIAKETALYEKELALLKERNHSLNVEIGSSEEKNILVRKVDAMDSFLAELGDTTHGQASEIATLKTLLMEAFAWVEDARSRQLYSKNTRYLHLVMNQGLDPVIKKHLLAIRNRIHYLETQLQQIDCTLDSQWSNFQNRCTKRNRMQQQNWTQNKYSPENPKRKEIHVPSSEFMYQTLINQQDVYERQKAHIDELEARVKSRTKWEHGNSMFAASRGFSQQSRKRGSPGKHKRSSLGEQELSSMAESLLAMQLGGSNLAGELSQSSCQNLLLPKKMPPRHMAQLCRLLMHRQMNRVIPSPRSISSSAVLHLPANMDPTTVSPVKSQTTLKPKPSAAVSSVKNVAVTLKQEVLSAKSSDSAPVVSAIPSGSNLTSTASLSGMSVIQKLPASSLPSVLGISTQKESSPVPVMNFLGPGMASNIVGSTNASVVTQTGSSARGLGSLSFSTGSLTSSTKSTSATVATSQAHSSSVAATTAAGSTSSIPLTFQATSSAGGNIFGGVAPSQVANTSSEVNTTWSFSPPSNFSIGSSAKPGGISTGKPVVPPVAASSLFAQNTAATSSVASTAFSLNFSIPSSQTPKQSFSLGTKPIVTQPSFSLPSSTFGSQNTTTPLGKEPLFVFGGSSLGASMKTATTEEVASEKKEETLKDEKKVVEEVKKEENDPGFSVGVTENKETTEQVTGEKQPTFSFGTAFGASGISFGKSLPTEPSSSTITASPAPLLSTEYEDVTPESKTENDDVTKEKPEEKPPTARSLFSEFNFKLSGDKHDVFPSKPSIFGGSSSSVVTSASLFGGSSTPVVTSSSLFGGSGTPAVTSASIFGVTSTAPVTSVTIFSSPDTQAATSAPTAFGSTSSSTVTTPSTIFSSLSTPSVSSSPIVFSSSGIPAVTTASLFGGTSSPVVSTPSVFGSSSSPVVTSSTLFVSSDSTAVTSAAALFSAPTSAPVSVASAVVTTSASVSMPIMSQLEPTGTTSNPLSSLGNIVANLGSESFNKPTTETTSPSNTFSTFSFSLPTKDNGTKTLPSDTAVVSPNESQKTPMKPFVTVSNSTAATTPIAGSVSGNADFGQGLANILGQSLPSSPAPTQQQSAPNPFAGTSGLFGSNSNGSSPNTASLFGKPAEGSPAVGLFGQALKQEPSSSFFGSPSSATPATTSGPTFGSGSVFGQPASPSGNIFGGGNFGSSKPIFGQTTATGFSLSGSLFGQSVGASSTPSLFGTNRASTAGSSPFQTPATASSSIFGSNSSGENLVFGSVAQSGFGSPGSSSSFQSKPGGFGGSPVFGAMAAGNTSPCFGGAATFGSAPAFGSHVFGSGTGSVFGSTLPPQGSAPASTFENLANAQTLTFGNLAQSSNPGSPFGAAASATSPTPAFGSAGGSGTGDGTSSFGGSSFTSWR